MKTILNFKSYNESIANTRLLTLKDLAEAIAINCGWDEETVYYMIMNAFRNQGDDGVMDLFKEATGVSIEPVIKGRYHYVTH